MTYALWPNHARMLGFMADRFAAELAPGSRIVEVGVGHGLMASVLFDLVPDLRYVGVDISPSSLDYASAALRDQQVDPARWTMVNADAIAGDLRHLTGPGGFDALLCCEVLEHVESPDTLLRNFRRRSAARAEPSCPRWPTWRRRTTSTSTATSPISRR